jgi:hypothetical protein
MRNETITVLSASDATSQNSAAITTGQILYASFHAVFSDTTAAGTVQVQASNDIPTGSALLGNFVPTNWTNVANASATVTAGGSFLIPIPINLYRWLRVTWTETTPGVGTITVNMNAFG